MARSEPSTRCLVAPTGRLRVHAELMAGGCRVSRKRVARLMREAGLAGVSRRRGMRTTRVDQSHCVVPDRVERQFQADAPDRLWVAVVTYVPTWAGFVYLAIVLDVFSRRVVGWSMTHHLRTELVLGALNMALGQRRPTGSCITPTGDRSTLRSPLGSGAGRWGWFPRPGRPGIASTTPWPRASLPRWSASSSTDARSVPRPKRAWRSSNSSKAGTTRAVVIRPWVTSAPTTTSGPRRRKRHVQCATLIVRLEPSPVLPGAASQRSRHTPRGHPIYRIGRRLYVHRLSPTSGLGTTALNCPLKRGNSSRKNEILTLRWEDVALDQNELRLPDAKTGARVVPLSPSAVRLLSGLPREPGNPCVIPGRKPGTHMSNVDQAWQVIRARAGLEDVRIHDLRHTGPPLGYWTLG